MCVYTRTVSPVYMAHYLCAKKEQIIENIKNIIENIILLMSRHNCVHRNSEIVSLWYFPQIHKSGRRIAPF